MLFIQSQCLKQPAGHETLKHFYGANRVPSPFGDKGTIKNAHMQEKRAICKKIIDFTPFTPLSSHPFTPHLPRPNYSHATRPFCDHFATTIAHLYLIRILCISVFLCNNRHATSSLTTSLPL